MDEGGCRGREGETDGRRERGSSVLQPAVRRSQEGGDRLVGQESSTLSGNQLAKRLKPCTFTGFDEHEQRTTLMGCRQKIKYWILRTGVADADACYDQIRRQGASSCLCLPCWTAATAKAQKQLASCMIEASPGLPQSQSIQPQSPPRLAGPDGTDSQSQERIGSQ